MDILLTGGAGYIGSVATEELIKAGYEVIVYDNLLQGHRQAVHPDAVFVNADLADRDRLGASSKSIPSKRSCTLQLTV